MKRLWIILIAAAALAAPLRAGVEYEARTWQEGKQANEQAEMNVHGMIDGEKARIEFVESANPWMSEGAYLLTTDAGRTLQLVKPADKTYGEFDLDSVMRMLGALGEAGIVSFEIENPKLETLAEGPGKTVAGVSTRHARYRTTYDMRMKIMGFKTMQNVQSTQDVWYTDELRDAAMGVWLRKEPPRTNTDLDRLIDLEVSKIKGFPLETVDTMVTTGKKGKQTTTITRMRVEKVSRGVSFPASTWVIPDDYTPVQMMPSAEMMAGQPPPEQSDGEEPKDEGGIMGRFKKLGRKKDG